MVDKAVGAAKSRQVDLNAGAEKYRWVDLDSRDSLDGST